MNAERHDPKSHGQERWVCSKCWIDMGPSSHPPIDLTDCRGEAARVAKREIPWLPVDSKAEQVVDGLVTKASKMDSLSKLMDRAIEATMREQGWLSPEEGAALKARIALLTHEVETLRSGRSNDGYDESDG